MHSFGYRANALLTLAVTVLTFMCDVASFSDTFNRSRPTVDIKVVSFTGFMKSKDGHDRCRLSQFSRIGLSYEVRLKLKVTADLQSLFPWNTKQVFTFVAAKYETPQNALNQELGYE